MKYLVLALVSLFTPVAQAVQWDLLGHLKYQPHYDYLDEGRRDTAYHSVDMRLGGKARLGSVEAEAHYQAMGLLNQPLRDSRPVPVPSAHLPADDERMVKLTDVVVARKQYYGIQRLDRLNLGYAGRTLVMRLGRQAVTWGNGIVYNPMDIFSPFGPVVIDKDYKTGDDMLFAQWLINSGADWQMVLMPRRDPVTRVVNKNASSTAIKYHNTTVSGDVDLLMAQHRGEDVFGLGYGVKVLQSAWHIDAKASRTDTSDDLAIAVTANMDYSFSRWGRKFRGFAEYYRNNLGQVEIDLSNADPELLDAIARGDAYTYGRDYVAAGIELELIPLFNIAPTMIVNLNDRSALIPVRVDIKVSEHLVLAGGVNLSLGNLGSEFGGPPTATSGGYTNPAQTAYARVAVYF